MTTVERNVDAAQPVDMPDSTLLWTGSEYKTLDELRRNTPAPEREGELPQNVRELPPALVERMVAHLLDCAAAHNIRPRDADAQRRYDEMKAIAAELPEVADGDEREADDLAEGCIWESIADMNEAKRAIRTALARGRQLEREGR